jgi:hypothetical protein
MLTHGVVIFKRVYDERVDSQLFGGFMSALNSFASQIDEGGISNFELGTKKFILRRKNDLVFIANCDTKEKNKNAEKELENVVERFFKRYPEDMVKNWSGNAAFFDEFTSDIEASLQTALDKLKDSFW